MNNGALQQSSVCIRYEWPLTYVIDFAANHLFIFITYYGNELEATPLPARSKNDCACE